MMEEEEYRMVSWTCLNHFETRIIRLFKQPFFFKKGQVLRFAFSVLTMSPKIDFHLMKSNKLCKNCRNLGFSAIQAPVTFWTLRVHGIPYSGLLLKPVFMLFMPKIKFGRFMLKMFNITTHHWTPSLATSINL
jgi:hypothetical protein